VWYDCTANKTCVMFLFNRNSQKIDFDRLTGFSHACIGKFILNESTLSNKSCDKINIILLVRGCMNNGVYISDTEKRVRNT